MFVDLITILIVEVEQETRLFIFSQYRSKESNLSIDLDPVPQDS